MNKDELEAFGERVRLIRKHFKISQKEFAEKMGIVGPYVSDIENGKGRPQLPFFFQLFAELNVNLNFLIGGKGEIFNPNPTSYMENGEIGFREITDDRQFLWLMENSPLFRMNILGMANVFFMNNRGIIGQSVRNALDKRPAGEVYDDE